MLEFFPKRFVLSLVGITATTLSIALQANVSIAIVYMVRPSSKITRIFECGSPRNHSTQTDNLEFYSTKLDWGPDIQGIVVSLQYLAMLIAFIPGGRLAETFGAKKTMITSLFVASLATVLSPIAASLSVYAFIACRMVVGLGSAPVFPILILMISRWIPDSEQNSASSFMLAGYGTGAFLIFLVGGKLCASEYFGGWPSVFYFCAAWGFVWCIWCFYTIYDFPDIHPTITLKEKEYIKANICLLTKKLSSVPWRSIVTSVPVWALSIGTFGQYWLLAFAVTSQTVYMGTVLNMESAENGTLSSIPSLLRGVVACLVGFLIDYIRKRRNIPIVYVRKGVTVFNSVVSCIGFVGILFSGCHSVPNVLFFVLATVCGDFSTFGVSMVPTDMAPNIGGTLSGIISCFGTASYVLLPILIGFFTKEEQSMAQWRYIYYWTIAITVATTAVYLIFGSSKPQTWATEDKDLPTRDDIEKDGVKLKEFDATLRRRNSMQHNVGYHICTILQV